MKQNRVISTTVLFLLLGTTIPSFAQKGQEEKGGGAEKAQPQRAEKAQPEQRAQKAQPEQRAQKAQPRAVASKSGGGHYGRISNANYTSHFGHDHSFHMGHPEMRDGYNRFQYSGYSFGYNQGWPEGWGYDDDFYVEYIDGVYYLCDLRFPGIEITLNMF